MFDSEARRLWETALGQLELQVSRPNYQTWLKDTVGLSYEEGSLLIGTPTEFTREWLQRKLYPQIEKTIANIVGRKVHLAFQVWGGEDGTAEGPAVWPATGAGPSTSLRAGPGGPGAERGFAGPSGSGITAQRGQGFNPRYRFQRFIAGEGGRLASAAALAVAEEPGSLYNPLFIYGGVGLGKTHLLHAIGHRVLEKGQAHILYTSAEQFTNEFIAGIANGTLEPFRKKYRSPDILLIDDIQFIAGKERTQEEFFHTFNDLHQGGKQIVLSSDRSPKLLTLLEDRLQSRFQWGLIADIQPPDLETRLAILRVRAQEQGLRLANEVLLLVAQQAHENVRELEGCVNRLAACARMKDEPITAEVAAEVLASLLRTGPAKGLAPEAVLEGVAQYFGLAKAALLSPRREKRIAYARQMAAYLLKELVGMRVTDIGRLLGNRDHSTILYACAKVQKAMEQDHQARRHRDEIRALLYR